MNASIEGKMSYKEWAVKFDLCRRVQVEWMASLEAA